LISDRIIKIIKKKLLKIITKISGRKIFKFITSILKKKGQDKETR
jgi:hypothetical protein